MGLPFLFTNMVHVTFDPSSPNGLVGLPDEWKEKLGSTIYTQLPSSNHASQVIDVLDYAAKRNLVDGIDDIRKECASHNQRLFIFCANPWKDYVESSQLVGEGGYSKVYRARRLATMEDVAIKVASMHSMNQICVELIMQYTIPHTNIVPISDCYSWDNNLYIVMEYMDRGSLADVVGPTIHWSESSIAYVCKCVLQAMAVIHSTHHIHRDIKSDNILVNSKGEVKLSDFGFATVVTSMNAERTSKVGTPFWMAPELIQGEGYTNKVDVWSLGITALEMADGEPPHFHDPPLKAMRMIHSGPSPTLRQPRNWTASFVDFLSKALDVDSEKRATAESLLSHPFLQFACSSTEFAHQMEQLTEMKKPK